MNGDLSFSVEENHAHTHTERKGEWNDRRKRKRYGIHDKTKND
jgi:hypothetical protein